MIISTNWVKLQKYKILCLGDGQKVCEKMSLNSWGLKFKLEHLGL